MRLVIEEPARAPWLSIRVTASGAVELTADAASPAAQVLEVKAEPEFLEKIKAATEHVRSKT